MTTFSLMWSEKLGAAIKAAVSGPYPVEFHANGEDFDSFNRAVSQGIDSRLEAVHFTQERGEYGRYQFIIEAASVPVLVRRLINSPHDNDSSLASSICSTLGIELI